MPHCFVSTLACCHVHCHMAMLRWSSRLLAGTFALCATQGLHVCNCFLALDPLIALGNGASVHAVVASRLRARHLDTSRRRTRGQQEDKKRTTGRQGLETGWQPRPSWRQQGDNRRKRGGQEQDKGRTRRGEDKDWRQASSRAKLECWNKDKKRTTRQQVDIGFTGAAKLDTSRRGTQRSPARPATASFFFLRENPNSTLLGEQGGITIQYYL